MRTGSEVLAYIRKEKLAAEQLVAQNSKTDSVEKAMTAKFWQGHVNAYAHMIDFILGGDGESPVPAAPAPLAPAPGDAKEPAKV